MSWKGQLAYQFVSGGDFGFTNYPDFAPPQEISGSGLRLEWAQHPQRLMDMKQPQHMRTSISRAPYPGHGHCAVCGQWTNLEMWDNGLAGRFCVDCFDYVVDAEQLLGNQLPECPDEPRSKQIPEISNEPSFFRRCFWKWSKGH